MKKTLKDIVVLNAFASMILFFVFSVLGLIALYGEGKLGGEIENAKCNREDCAADRTAAVVVSSDEIEELEHDVDGRSDDDSKLAKPKAAADKHKLGQGNHEPGAENRTNLVPVDDRNDEHVAGGDNRHDYRHRKIVDFHKNILLCLMCIFNILIPVAINVIIPHDPD